MYCVIIKKINVISHNKIRTTLLHQLETISERWQEEKNHKFMDGKCKKNRKLFVETYVYEFKDCNNFEWLNISIQFCSCSFFFDWFTKTGLAVRANHARHDKNLSCFFSPLSVITQNIFKS